MIASRGPGAGTASRRSSPRPGAATQNASVLSRFTGNSAGKASQMGSASLNAVKAATAMSVQPLDALTQINLDDLIGSFGWTGRPLLAPLLRRIYRSEARTFAQQMLEFDDAAGHTGLWAAARQALAALCVRELRVYGEQYLPAHGPALFLSNHPGMMDTICLFAAINRADLKIIAVQRPFLVSLENTARHCLFVDDEPAKRLNALRQVANHLRRGGCALNFPAG